VGYSIWPIKTLLVDWRTTSIALSNWCLGTSKRGDTLRCLGIEVDDSRGIGEQIDA
jgi:hypothetical protein